jgi:hypothetical protein
VPQHDPSCESSISEMAPTLPTTSVLDLSAFVPPFALAGLEATGAGPAAARAVPGVVVVTDAAGEVLGPVAGGDTLPLTASALFAAAGGLAPVALLGHEALAGTALVVYGANDCTGPAFLRDPGAAAFFPAVGVAADGTLLGDAGPAAPLAVGSSWSPFEDASNPCAPGGGPAEPVRATTVLADLATRPTPFRLEVRPGGPDGPPGSRESLRGLRLHDAAGRLVGPVIATGLLGADVTALVRAGRRAGEVVASPERFLEGTRRARFESADCTGPVLVEAPDAADPRPLYPATALGPGDLLHAADGPFDTADLQSRWDAGSATCVPDALGGSFVQRTSPLADLSGFTPPFQVR